MSAADVRQHDNGRRNDVRPLDVVYFLFFVFIFSFIKFTLCANKNRRRMYLTRRVCNFY